MTLRTYLICSAVALLAVSLWLFRENLIMVIVIFGPGLLGLCLLFAVLRWIWRAGSR